MKGNTSAHIKAGDIYCINFDPGEDVFVYSYTQSGVMLINSHILKQKQHNQINFYDLVNKNILCEIKPFYAASKYHFNINRTIVKLVDMGGLSIYLNNSYYGKIDCGDEAPTFEKIFNHDKAYGLIKFEKHKYLIFFNESEILYCGKYLDYEILKDCMQIYEHTPNVFNIGKLIKYRLDSGEIDCICVNDRSGLINEQNDEFRLEYFMEALKCGRYKYAYEKLSYELRADISTDTLKQYFKQFNDCKYIDKTNTYITFNNRKIVGVYRFDINQNFIDNIY